MALVAPRAPVAYTEPPARDRPHKEASRFRPRLRQADDQALTGVCIYPPHFLASWQPSPPIETRRLGCILVQPGQPTNGWRLGNLGPSLGGS